MNPTTPHPPVPATTADAQHWAVLGTNWHVCLDCGLPIKHPIHTQPSRGNQ